MKSPRALACPHCGGTVAPPLATRRVECQFCGRAHYYTGSDFLPSMAFRPVVGEKAVRDSVLRVLRSRYLPTDFARRALLVQSRRSYLPYYLFTGKRGGLLMSGRERVVAASRVVGRNDFDQVGMMPGRAKFARTRPQTVKEEDVRVVLGDFRYLYPAVATSGWEVDDEALRQNALARLEQAVPASPAELAGEAEVLDPDIPLAHLLERGVAAKEATGDLRVLYHHAALLHVPIQTLTFRYGREYYRVRAEELTGTVLGGRLPFRRDWGYLMGGPLVAGMGWITGLALKVFGVAPAGEWAKAALVPQVAVAVSIFLLVAAGLVTAGLTAAWQLMRRPYSVAVFPDGPRLELDGEAPASPLLPVTDLIWGLLKALLDSGGRRQ